MAWLISGGKENLPMKSSKLWYLEQSVMSMVNLQDTFAKIQASDLHDNQKDELTGMLLFLFESAHAKMIQGREDNPVHHNTMVLHLMTEIALKEKDGYDYMRIKDLLALSLLHDIGYAETTAKKWTSAEVKAAVKGKADAEIQSIVAEAMQARDEHMRKGAGIVECMLREANTHFPEPLFEEGRIHAIGEVVAIHDRPSSAKLKEKYLPALLSKDDLLPTKNELAKALRDADRLWMATAQGVKKDLIFAGEEVTEANLNRKLQDNSNSFQDEKRLYEKVYQNQDEVANFGFMGDTLFRTKVGYGIYERLSNPEELMKEMKRIANLAVDMESGLVEALWRTKGT
jgi:HD superfamily phosphodiesterase